MNKHPQNWVGQISERPPFRTIAVSLTLVFTLLTSGCSLSLGPMAKHTAAFSTATTTIVDNSEDAYRAAIQLHHDEQVAAAIDAYDTPGWNPYTALTPLLTPEQLDARIKVLDALKAYAQALSGLTDSKSRNDKLGAAAAAAGANLQSLSASPSLTGIFPKIPSDQLNIVTTAIVGLSEFLIQGRVKKALKSATADMNPNVEALCKLIDSDVTILRRQADVDFQTLLTNKNQFIQKSQLEPSARRAEIGKLVTLGAQQQANDALLEKLHKSVVKLALTHQALAAAAQGNDPVSLKQTIAELTSAGWDLSNYYKSLPK